MQTEAPSRTNPEAAKRGDIGHPGTHGFPEAVWRSGTTALSRRTDPPFPPEGASVSVGAPSGTQDRALRAGEEPGLDQELEHLALHHRAPVEPLHREASSAVGPHPGDERVDHRPQPLRVRFAQREQ